jgi:hypothetical protein
VRQHFSGTIPTVDHHAGVSHWGFPKSPYLFLLPVALRGWLMMLDLGDAWSNSSDIEGRGQRGMLRARASAVGRKRRIVVIPTCAQPACASSGWCASMSYFKTSPTGVFSYLCVFLLRSSSCSFTKQHLWRGRLGINKSPGWHLNFAVPAFFCPAGP